MTALRGAYRRVAQSRICTAVVLFPRLRNARGGLDRFARTLPTNRQCIAAQYLFNPQVSVTKKIHELLSIALLHDFVVERLELLLAHFGERLRCELRIRRGAIGMRQRSGSALTLLDRSDDISSGRCLRLSWCLAGAWLWCLAGAWLVLGRCCRERPACRRAECQVCPKHIPMA